MITNYIQNKVEQKPIRTGLASFDYVTGGLVRGKTYEISGCEASGKTSLALNISKSLISKKWKLVYFNRDNNPTYNIFNRYGLTNSKKNNLISSEKDPQEIRNMCLDFLEKEEKIIIVIDSLTKMLFDLVSPGEATNHNYYIEEQLILRPILADILLAVKKAGGLLFILNNPRICQFDYMVQNRFRQKEIQSPFPIHLIEGYINLKIHKIDMYGSEAYGQHVKITCKKNNSLENNYLSDKMHMSFDKGFSNCRALINIAKKQGLINKIPITEKSVIYHSSQIQNFPQKQNLISLNKSFEKDKALRAEVIKLIDWRKTIYGTQPENR